MAVQVSGDKELVHGYLGLRRAIGVLGMALPWVLAFGARMFLSTNLQRSISSYYHTGMRDVFVGTMCAVGVFLFMYRGYERTDERAAMRAGLCAIGLALIPTASATPTSLARTLGEIHLVLTIVFFLHLIYFAGWLFTKTDPKRAPTPRKIIRNRIYRACATVMGATMAGLLIHRLLPPGMRTDLEALRPVFWCEAIAIFFFGVSWLVKGEAILKDDDYVATDARAAAAI